MKNKSSIFTTQIELFSPLSKSKYQAYCLLMLVLLITPFSIFNIVLFPYFSYRRIKDLGLDPAYIFILLIPILNIVVFFNMFFDEKLKK